MEKIIKMRCMFITNLLVQFATGYVSQVRRARGTSKRLFRELNVKCPTTLECTRLKIIEYRYIKTISTDERQ